MKSHYSYLLFWNPTGKGSTNCFDFGHQLVDSEFVLFRIQSKWTSGVLRNCLLCCWYATILSLLLQPLLLVGCKHGKILKYYYCNLSKSNLQFHIGWNEKWSSNKHVIRVSWTTTRIAARNKIGVENIVSKQNLELSVFGRILYWSRNVANWFFGTTDEWMKIGKRI